MAKASGASPEWIGGVRDERVNQVGTANGNVIANFFQQLGRQLRGGPAHPLGSRDLQSAWGQYLGTSATNPRDLASFYQFLANGEAGPASPAAQSEFEDWYKRVFLKAKE